MHVPAVHRGKRDTHDEQGADHLRVSSGGGGQRVAAAGPVDAEVGERGNPVDCGHSRAAEEDSVVRIGSQGERHRIRRPAQRVAERVLHRNSHRRRDYDIRLAARGERRYEGEVRSRAARAYPG